MLRATRLSMVAGHFYDLANGSIGLKRQERAIGSRNLVDLDTITPLLYRKAENGFQGGWSEQANAGLRGGGDSPPPKYR
jgi:hypothetical protein